MNVNKKIQGSKTEYKQNEKELQKENSGKYGCVVIYSIVLDGKLYLTLQSEFGIHNINFCICNSTREKYKSEIIEELENKTKANVKYPESFIGKKAFIKNIYETKNSFIIFESDTENYISRLHINRVDKNGRFNQDPYESNHISFIIIFSALVFFSFFIFNFLPLVIPTYIKLFYGIWILVYTALISVLHTMYKPIVKQVDNPYENL